MAFHYDPGAEKRSLMMQQTSLCNGQKTGRCCCFYWAHVEKVESANADYLRRGEMYRACSFPGGGAALHVHEMSSEQLATECNQYKARKLPIWKRPLAALGLVDDPGKYDPRFEDYKPLTPDEIRDLQKQYPQAPIDENAVVGSDDIAKKNVEEFAEELSLSEALVLLNEDTDSGIFADKNEEDK